MLGFSILLLKPLIVLTMTELLNGTLEAPSSTVCRVSAFKGVSRGSGLYYFPLSGFSSRAHNKSQSKLLMSAGVLIARSEWLRKPVPVCFVFPGPSLCVAYSKSSVHYCYMSKC